MRVRRGPLVEYWAHEAALVEVDDWPLLRWRMRQYRHHHYRLACSTACQGGNHIGRVAF